VGGLLVFIGAKPGTEWPAGQLAEDRNGFLPTRSDIPAAGLENEHLAPLFLGASQPSVFAVGDVRSGSVKRVAACTAPKCRHDAELRVLAVRLRGAVVLVDHAAEDLPALH
jgi:thioredoxin reductase